ncbi:MAG TPA: glycosyltransferase family 2 protein [Longimicrobium sp.]|nr:glycosyltransferase family 2 protein [Longimicrobium sp.]
MKLSVVVPTRNRPESLHRLLDTLARQELLPDEVIVVDASDAVEAQGELARRYPGLNLRHLPSEPSVCVQRNIGVRAARGEYVFLCDDDMEVPEDYVSRLVTHLDAHPDVAAASGIVVDRSPAGEGRTEFPVPSLGDLCFRFLFQLPIWGGVDGIRTGIAGKLPYALLKRYYTRRDNGLSAAGWPVITSFGGSSFRTRVWSLGASIIRRDALGQNPYDEVLDQHGIGDNYDASLKLPGHRPIAVLAEARVYHHKAAENRLASSQAYFRRTLALHYFLVKHPSFSRWNRLLFVWSLVGKQLEAWRARDPDKGRATRRILRLVLTGRNPYVLAHRSGGGRTVAPTLSAAD